MSFTSAKDEVENRLIIRDAAGAQKAVEKLLKDNPQDLDGLRLLVEVQAMRGNPQAMLAAYDSYLKCQSKESERNFLLEKICWSILEKGIISPLPMGRAVSLVGAAEAQDCRSPLIVAKALNDQDARVRLLAVRSMQSYPDTVTRKALLQLLQHEVDWGVRMEAVRMLGAMRLEEGKPWLAKWLEDTRLRAEDRAIAIEALVNMTDALSDQELRSMLESNRFALRVIGCQAIAWLHLTDKVDELQKLLNDSHPEVVQSALEAFALLGKSQAIDTTLLKKLMADSDPKIFLSAARCGLLLKQTQAKEVFRQALKNERFQFEAVAILGGTGSHGKGLILEAFESSHPLLIQANLALAIISNRMADGATLEKAVDCLEHALESHERLCWVPVSLSRFLSLQGERATVEDPTSEDLLARLQLLGIVATVNPTKAQKWLEQYLLERSWGISGMASLLLLQEGDLQAQQLVRDVMCQKELARCRIQAALILAMWSRDAAAIQLLEESYASSPRELKEYILISLGKIGHERSIPFLTERLKESSEQLRIVAATSLLLTLNH